MLSWYVPCVRSCLAGGVERGRGCTMERQADATQNGFVTTNQCVAEHALKCQNLTATLLLLRGQSRVEQGGHEDDLVGHGKDPLFGQGLDETLGGDRHGVHRGTID